MAAERAFSSDFSPEGISIGGGTSREQIMQSSRQRERGRGERRRERFDLCSFFPRKEKERVIR
jgi:hypothetical protein